MVWMKCTNSDLTALLYNAVCIMSKNMFSHDVIQVISKAIKTFLELIFHF